MKTTHEKHRQFVREQSRHSPRAALAGSLQMADCESIEVEKTAWRELADEIKKENNL